MPSSDGQSSEVFQRISQFPVASLRLNALAAAVVRTDFEQRAALLADDPGTFYVTDHYVRHPVVLVRMNRLQQDQLRGLLAAARQCVLTHADQKKARRREQGGYDRSRSAGD